MPNLTDYIEEYLKKLLALSTESYIEVQRRELANKFACVPSQINYVLERRFSLERGYLVESRRGGGGCIRIYRVDPGLVKPWRDVINRLNGGEFDPDKVRQLLKRMHEERIISTREVRLLESLVRNGVFDTCGISRTQARKLQRELFSTALEELLKVGY